jgi:hypothetical protein
MRVTTQKGKGLGDAPPEGRLAHGLPAGHPKLDERIAARSAANGPEQGPEARAEGLISLIWLP